MKTHRLLFINALLSVVTGVMIFAAPFSHPYVTQFAVAQGEVSHAGVVDQQLRVTFSRPMDEQSVEKNLTISPPIDGNISWANDTLFFTPKKNLPYQQAFTLTIGKDATDIYHQHLHQPYSVRFQTRDYAFVYEDHDHQLTLSDMQGHIQQISSGKIIKEYVVSSEGKFVAYLHQPTDEGETSVYFYDMNNKQTAQLVPNLHGHLANLQVSKDGAQLYFLANENETAVTYVYDIAKKTLSKMDLSAYPTLTRFWLTPDGNALLINDLSGELYLQALQGKKSVAVGKYADYRGGTRKGDTLLFVDVSPEFNYVQGVVLYDGNAQRVTDVQEITASPFLSSDGRVLVYSYIPKNTQQDAGQEGMKLLSLPDKKVLWEKYDPSLSFELGKISADDRYVALEVFTKSQLQDFNHIRKYGEPNKPDHGVIEFIDTQTGKVLPFRVDGTEFTWIE